jgi:peptide/nickel transport system substrate-binding protein
MRHHRRTAALIGAAAVAAVALAACSSSGGGNTKSSSNTGNGTKTVSAAYNAANSGIVNASTKKGGVVKYAESDAPDSMDPGNTYYAYSWDFSRLYARALTTFAPVAGKASLQLHPDLAASLGTPSNGGKTWTYHIRPGLKYSDGTPITTQDVKYAIERSNYTPGVLGSGPAYFNATLVNNKAGDCSPDQKTDKVPAGCYPGPYKDKSKAGLKSIVTPNATTIVFHLNAPFADFDYLVSNPETAPVPQAKDTGATYVQHIVSSGSYMFKSYADGKGAVLVPNTNWSAASDPLRKQYATEIDLAFHQNQDDVDSDLLAGNITGDVAGAGVAVATQSKVLTNPTYKAESDDALSGALAYMGMSTKVKPLDNLDCRKAVEYAVNKVSVQNALGGPLRGAIASTMLPPNVVGYQKYDLYPTPSNSGDVAKAKSELAKCGHPNGFSVGLGERSDRPNEVAGATAIQASLKKVGITANIQGYPSGKYTTDNAGSPAFVHAHDMGLMMYAWAADWPTGYGFLDQVVAGNAIKPAGNSNISELNDPKVNQLLDSAIQNTDTAARTKAWGEVDKQVMTDAAIVPLTYRLDLLLRPKNATNVAVTAAYGMYDYLNIGTK